MFGLLINVSSLLIAKFLLNILHSLICYVPLCQTMDTAWSMITVFLLYFVSVLFVSPKISWYWFATDLHTTFVTNISCSFNWSCASNFPCYSNQPLLMYQIFAGILGKNELDESATPQTLRLDIFMLHEPVCKTLVSPCSPLFSFLIAYFS